MQYFPVNTGFLFELEKHFQVQSRAVLLATLGMAFGCAPVPLPDGERRVALKTATEQVILPTYAA